MIVVNIFGAPGDGKSTTAAGLFARLKLLGVNAELVTEAAKEWTWERTEVPLRWQPKVFGEQSYRIERLAGQVDAVVTDSPILLSLLYAPPDMPPAFAELVRWAHRRHRSVDIRVRRPASRRYQQAGRWQTEEESAEIGRRLDALLMAEGIVPLELESDCHAPHAAVDAVFRAVQREIEKRGR